MSRLIDADEFIKELGLDAENSREENLGEIVTLEDFDRQPTAYDVEKVVEQTHDYLIKIVAPHTKLYQTIMEIIKKGGVEDAESI